MKRIIKIKNLEGEEVFLKPRLELYNVADFMGSGFGLAIVLDELDENENPIELYATLTVSFGEFIGMKNAAYVDTNNCWFADQLFENYSDIVEKTSLTKRSGFCEYPLCRFSPDFLKDIGEENYKMYADQYEVEEDDEDEEDEEKIDYEAVANTLIDYLCERDGIFDTIKLLFDAGCTKDELLKMQFNEDDIKYVMEE